MSKGRIEDAFRILDTVSQPREKIQMLMQIMGQFGASQSNEVATGLLDQARRMIGGLDRAENAEQMNALFLLSSAFARFDSAHGLEILEPLIAQFNEMCDAGLTLNGFGQECFRDGELMMHNGNNLGNIASQLIASLAASSRVDFDRAKLAASRLSRPEVQISAYIAICESASR